MPELRGLLAVRGQLKCPRDRHARLPEHESVSDDLLDGQASPSALLALATNLGNHAVV